MLNLKSSRMCLLLVCIALLMGGCGGGGSHQAEMLAPSAPEIEIAWPGMPIDTPPLPEAARVTAATDNWQNGADAWQISESGATVEGTMLRLVSPPGDLAWGIWRWGVFDPGIFPEQLKLELTPDPSQQYWLLLSNYTLDKWDYLGPYLPAADMITLDPATTYVSPSGYAYFAFAVHDGNQITVERLNVIASENVNPPLAPQDLTISNITHESLRLNWTKNTEPDLSKYNIYSGPNDGFELADAGVELLGSVNMLQDTFYPTELDSETDYYFRISALNAALVESPLSATAAATTLIAPNYNPPTDLTLDAVSGGWADISWTIDAGPGLDGIDVYLGPALDFELADPGVFKHNQFKVSADSYRVTGLTAETEYYCRLQATYLTIHKSELSETLTFSTTTSVPAVPDFSYLPNTPEQNEPVTFDPSATTDIDTLPEDLTFKWDFDNDGTVDQTTLGPDTVEHTFADRGTHTVKLTVFDGADVEFTRDLVVSWKYDLHFMLSQGGYPGQLVAMDADPSNGQIAALIFRDSSHIVKWFNGSSWFEYDVDLGAEYYWDIALSPNGISVLVGDWADLSVTWKVKEYSAGIWTDIATDTHDSMPWRGALDFAPNGRLSVVCLTRTLISGEPVELLYKLYVSHQKADDAFSTHGPFDLDVNSYEPIAIERSDTTTYALYANSGAINQWEITDGSDVQTAEQTHADAVTYMSAGQDEASPDHIFWAFSTDGSRVYYGDNYGTANGGTQYYESTDATALLGAGLAGDNAGTFFWSTEAASGTQTVLGYDSATGGSPTEYVTGPGACQDGLGVYYYDGSTSGVYMITTENRDGECVGRFMDGLTEGFSEAVYEPYGSIPVTLYHQVLAFADDSILGVHTQGFPTTLGTYLATLDASPVADQLGWDAWCDPRAACITDTPGEFFSGSISEAGQLYLDRFNYGDPVGLLEETISGVGLVQLEYQPATNEPIVFYSTNSGVTLYERRWDGAAWSAETAFYDDIEVLKLDVAMNGSKIGVAFVDADSNAVLVEYDAGWQTPMVLSTDTLNTDAGISIDYNASGDGLVCVERNDADPGIYLGTIPAGGVVSWERLNTTDGMQVSWIHAFNHLAEPLVVYYHLETPPLANTIRILDHESGSWASSTLPFRVHGNPVDATIDSSGNIVLAGYSSLFSTYRAVLAVIYP